MSEFDEFGIGDFYKPPRFDMDNLPPGWKVGEDGVLSFGDESAEVGALDAYQYGLYLQAKWLTAQGINDHPIITESRLAIDWNERWNDLAGAMSSSATALAVLVEQSDTSPAETLDSLAFHRPHFPDQRVNLMAFWRNVHLHGTGVFYLGRFIESIDPASLGDEVVFARDAATSNLLSSPIAFLNCLNAARMYAHPSPIEGVMLAYRSENPFDEDVGAFQHDALGVLGGTQIQDRPFATWYLLFTSAIQRARTAYTRHLVEAASETAQQETIATLNRIDLLVGRVVADQWDGWSENLHVIDLDDVDGRIRGALEYAATAFYPSARTDYYSSYDYDAYEKRREQERMTAEVTKEVGELAKKLRYEG